MSFLEKYKKAVGVCLDNRHKMWTDFRKPLSNFMRQYGWRIFRIIIIVIAALLSIPWVEFSFWGFVEDILLAFLDKLLNNQQEKLKKFSDSKTRTKGD